MNRSKTNSAIGTLILVATYIASSQAAFSGGYIEAGIGTGNVAGTYMPQGGVCGASCSVFGSYYTGLPAGLPRTPIQHQVPQMPYRQSGWINGGYHQGNGVPSIGYPGGAMPYPMPVPGAPYPGAPVGGGVIGGGAGFIDMRPSYEQNDLAGIIFSLGSAMAPNSNVFPVAPERRDITIPQPHFFYQGSRETTSIPRLGSIHGEAYIQ